jgi:hypothetical protein
MKWIVGLFHEALFFSEDTTICPNENRTWICISNFLCHAAVNIGIKYRSTHQILSIFVSNLVQNLREVKYDK